MSFGKVILNEVFGISPKIPKYNYVDRNNLDRRFKDLMTSGSHLVIHGSSKQGKTVIRRKNLPDDRCIIIPCRLELTLSEIYAEILRQAGVGIPTEIKEQLTGGMEAKGGISPFFEGKSKLESTTSVSSVPQGSSLDNVNYIAETIKGSRKTVVIEDFHYLPENERRILAFDLKALWDCSVSLVIVGVWQQENLLCYYNGELSGRIEEIDVKWKDSELSEVLEKGARKLNITFNSKLANRIIKDSSGNVGLLQDITKRLCLASGITDNIAHGRAVISNYDSLANCRQQVCRTLYQRYRTFGELVSNGYSNNNLRKTYEGLLRVCVEAEDDELRAGLHKDIVRERLEHVLQRSVATNSFNLVLKNLVKLQIDRKIFPIVLSYNDDTRKIQLVDHQFLFFRRYIGQNNLPWPWLEAQD